MQTPGKQPPSETWIAREVERLLAERIPPGWTLGTRTEVPSNGFRVDLLVEIASPTGEAAVLAVETKRTLESRDLSPAIRQISEISATLPGNAGPVLVAAYFSPRARTLLRERGIGYVDVTGNVCIAISRPGLFILTSGADRDPWPRDHRLQSLRGRGAARAVRAIVDTRPPYGVRELAKSTGASAPTVSRVLDLLEREAIVVRNRGAVSTVDWRAAILRWAEDYSQSDSNTPMLALEPRGLPAIESKLRAAKSAYAVTGAFAAQRFDPVAPARSATVYVTNAAKFMDQLGLREVEAGANVVVLEPFDSVVFDRTMDCGGLRCVAPSQLAVDLLTGPGREPSQGEHFLKWLERNEDVWRS